MCINHIHGNNAHRDANIEADRTEKSDSCFDVLVKVVRCDGSHRGIADPQSAGREVEDGDREKNHPTDLENLIPSTGLE